MNEKKKKYWLFYLISKVDIYGSLPYDIYAFTDDIELAESFVNTRNMNMFYTKQKKLNKKEINELLKTYMTCELGWMEITTKIKEKYKVGRFNLPLTLREKQSCYNMSSLYLDDYIYRTVWDDNRIFKNKYANALDVLLYSGLREYLNGNEYTWSETNAKLVPDYMEFIFHDFRDLFIKPKKL